MPENNSAFNVELFKQRLNKLISENYSQDYYTLDVLSIDIKNKLGSTISKPSLSNLTSEKHTYKPSSDTLISLAKFFNVSVDYLIGLTNTRSSDIVDQKMSEKYGLSDNAMVNLAKLKKQDNNSDIFSEFKILQIIMEDSDFLTELSKYFYEHFELPKKYTSINDEQEFKKNMRAILAETQFLTNEFTEQIYNRLVQNPSSDYRLVKYPHREWGKVMPPEPQKQKEHK